MLSLTEWQPRHDGGNPPQFKIIEHNGEPTGLSVEYSNHPPYWGNLQTSVAISPNTTGFSLTIDKRSASSGAQLTLGLEEPDGDVWFGEILYKGKSFGYWPNGPVTAEVPISSFKYEPRGNSKRQLPDAKRLILVCNYGDSSFVLERLAILTLPSSGAARPVERSVNIVRGSKGTVALLDDELPENPAAADISILAGELEKAGYGVNRLNGADVMDPKILNRHHFDILVLPNSPYYPLAGRDTLLKYLKSGGKLLCFGGYAFDHPVVFDNGRWVPADIATTAEMMDEPSRTASINTRYGIPGDTMGLSPDQIGLFDPACRYQSAQIVSVLGKKLKKGDSRPLDGYSAVSVIGNDNPVYLRVWSHTTPLVEAKTATGLTPIASLARIYDGPFSGSAWAFFGCTNTDILENPAVRSSIPEILRSLTDGIVIHDLAVHYDFYQPDEQPVATLWLGNYNAEARSIRLVLNITFRNLAGRSVTHFIRQTITIKPDTSRHLSWKPNIAGVAPGSFCRLTAKAFSAGGVECDAESGGFVISDTAEERAKWPRFTFHDNHFSINGHPEFLVGTNLTGAVFAPGDNENPLTWEHDFADMEAHGIRIVRVLHFSPFVTWLKNGRTATATDLADPLPRRLMSKLDALIQIAAHHGIAIFLSLHDWIPVTLSDAELRDEQMFVERVAHRYRDAGNIIFDIQNEPSVDWSTSSDIERLWNSYLRDKYRTDEELRQAWSISPPRHSLGSIQWRPGTDQWADMRTWDANHFKTVLLNRWIAANVEAIRRGGSNAPITVGFLPFLSAADKILGQRDLDFSNMHYYGSPSGLAPEFALTDRRFEGKGLSIGEFGAQNEHTQRVDGQDVTANDAPWFMQLGLTAYGMGASFIENWCWKDMDGVVFPWGVVGRDGRPKPTLFALQRIAKIGRDMGPNIERPQVYLLIPDYNRQGAQSDVIINALHHAVRMLIGAHVPFGVINENSLVRLPADARVLIWPIPFCPSTVVFQRVMNFVRNGGTLYVSGDLSYDSLRRHDRLTRLTELCGVRFEKLIAPNIEVKETVPGALLNSPCIAVQPVSAEKRFLPEIGTVYTNVVGKGKVFYTSDPIEIHSTDPRLYQAFLKFAGIHPIEMQPDDPQVEVYAVHTMSGKKGFTVINGSTAKVTITLPGMNRSTSVTLEPGASRLVIIN